VISLNPWKYAEPDLLTPLVGEIVNRLKAAGYKDWTPIVNASATLLKLGVDLLARYAESKGHCQVDEVATATKFAIDRAESFVAKKSNRLEYKAGPLDDPGDGFRDLIDRLLGTGEERRVLICVDDLDRCTPERQVAFLEAIQFIRSFEARAIIVFAIDPEILRGSIRTHYGLEEVDGDAYLDKIFDYSQDLRPLDIRGVDLLGKRLAEVPTGLPGTLGEMISTSWITFSPNMQAWAQPLPGSMLTPRLVDHMCRRLEMLVRSKPPPRPISFLDSKGHLFWVWLAGTQAWPTCRREFSRAHQLLNTLRMGHSTRFKTSTTASRDMAFPLAVDECFKEWPDLVRALRQVHSRIIGNTQEDAQTVWVNCFQDIAELDSVFADQGL
jgi:hypothetical protein